MVNCCDIRACFKTKKDIVYNSCMLIFFLSYTSPPTLGYRLEGRVGHLGSYDSLSWYLQKFGYIYPFVTDINTASLAPVERVSKKWFICNEWSKVAPLYHQNWAPSLPLVPKKPNRNGNGEWHSVEHCPPLVSSSISFWKGMRWNPPHLLWGSPDRYSSLGSVIRRKQWGAMGLSLNRAPHFSVWVQGLLLRYAPSGILTTSTAWAAIPRPGLQPPL
jgi:hypothetical protein